VGHVTTEFLKRPGGMQIFVFFNRTIVSGCLLLGREGCLPVRPDVYGFFCQQYTWEPGLKIRSPVITVAVTVMITVMVMVMVTVTVTVILLL
jgi:hypothetical protein